MDEFRRNNVAPGEYANVRFVLADLSATEILLFGGKQNLGTDHAAVCTRNHNKVRDRWADFNAKRF